MKIKLSQGENDGIDVVRLNTKPWEAQHSSWKNTEA
jgi:hypothetical protein